MPPPLQEILDSEDEEEISPVKSRLDQADPNLSSGESVPVELSTSEQGTGSTDEQLRRAHQDLMASTQDAIDVAAPINSTSPSLPRTKRRLTGSNDLPPPPPSSARQPKRIKTDPVMPHLASSEATVPGPTFPETAFLGTGDTIAGATLPFMHMSERQTPAKRTRKPSIDQPLSDNKSVSLTPWTVSAFSSSDQRKEHSNSSSEKRSQPRSSAQKQAELYNSDHLGSDDITAIGLPKEQYKPRPSRSRSTQVLIEPIDYSVRPEKLAKAKRNATTGSPAKPTIPNPFPERPILDSPGFEALSPPPESANPYPLSEVAAGLPSLHEAIPEMAPPATKALPKKPLTKKAAPKTKPKQYGKRGRPRKQPEVVISDDEEDEDELALNAKQQPDLDAQAGQVEVQVIISPQPLTQISTPDDKAVAAAQQDLASEIVAKLKQAENPRPKAAQSVDEENTNDKEPKTSKFLDSALAKKETLVEDTDEKASTPAAVAKKATARKATSKPANKKNGNKKEPETSVILDPALVPAEQNDEETSTPQAVAKKATAKAAKKQTTNKKDPETSKSLDSTLAKLEPPVEDTVEETGEEKTNTPEVAATQPATVAESSPLIGSNKPQTPLSRYRVGLSKTQRIPSLLRVFKR